MKPNLFETIQSFKKQEHNPKSTIPKGIEKYDFETEIAELFKGRGADYIISIIEDLQIKRDLELEGINNINLDLTSKPEIENRLSILNQNLSLYIGIDSLIFQYSFCLEKYFLGSEMRYYFLRYFSEDENTSVFQKFFRKIMLPFLLSENLTFESFQTELELFIHFNYPNFQINDFNLNKVSEALLPFFKTNHFDSIGNPVSELRNWAMINELEDYDNFIYELDYRLLLLLEYFMKIDQNDTSPEIEKYINQYLRNWDFV